MRARSGVAARRGTGHLLPENGGMRPGAGWSYRAGLAVLVDRNIRRFTKNFDAPRAASGTRDPKPLFIVAMYRSGTTLAEHILSSHSDIAAGDELTVWTPTDLEIDATNGELDPVRARSATAKYLSVLQKIGPSAARVTDKPPFNAFRLGAIHRALAALRALDRGIAPVDFT